MARAREGGREGAGRALARAPSCSPAWAPPARSPSLRPREGIACGRARVAIPPLPGAVFGAGASPSRRRVSRVPSFRPVRGEARGRPGGRGAVGVRDVLREDAEAVGGAAAEVPGAEPDRAPPLRADQEGGGHLRGVARVHRVRHGGEGERKGASSHDTVQEDERANQTTIRRARSPVRRRGGGASSSRDGAGARP